MSPLSNETLLKEFRRTGIEQSGHFVLNSELHSNQKLEFDVLLDHPRLLRKIVKNVAGIASQNSDDTVIAVPHGAERIAANGWSYSYPQLAYAKKLSRREFGFSSLQAKNIESAQRIAIFEDVVTTGGTPAALGRAVLQINPTVELDLIAIAKRSPLLPENEELFRSAYFLAEVNIDAWPASACESCSEDL